MAIRFHVIKFQFPKKFKQHIKPDQGFAVLVKLFVKYGRMPFDPKPYRFLPTPCGILVSYQKIKESNIEKTKKRNIIICFKTCLGLNTGFLHNVTRDKMS